MKSRPEPKKISYIKPNNTKNIYTKNNTNNKNTIKTKKQNNVIDNLLIMNSPKKTYISSSNKINEKLLNKIKQYSLEAHLLNQAKNKISKNNINKNNIKQSQENNNNNSIIKKNKKQEELRYNSLDTKNSIPKLRTKNNNINKLYTERNLNPFIKTQKINKNIQIKTLSNEKEENSEKRNENLRNAKKNNFRPHHSLSRERKKNNVLNTNFKYTKPKLLTNFNLKRNVSANNRIMGNKKLSNYNKRENEEEFNINNMEENENLLFDIHTSYNLTNKNPFNFYCTDIQFRSSKNMLNKNSKNKKINFGIKEENENDDNNNSEFSFRKEKEKLNRSNDNQFLGKNSNYINEIKKRAKNKIQNNKKESTLSSLHKKGINFDSINKDKDILSSSELKGFGTPDGLEYSLEKKRKILNMRNKNKNLNKYYILKNNGIIYSKKLSNNNDIEKNNYVNVSEKQKKIYKNENSLNTKNKYRNKNEIDKNKSPTNEKNNNSNNNYHNHKFYFINSPQSNNISNLNRNKYENSYDDTFRRSKIIEFHKILRDDEKPKEKEKEKNSSKYQSKSHSNSKPKSRAKSHLNKMENFKKDINRLNKLIFIIRTNWGNIIKIGINKIKLLDRNNKTIPIKYANYDFAKPYIIKYIKGETKKLVLGYDKNYILKNISILNGFNDTGVKYLMIENDRGKILWKGNIPKINMINVKQYYIPIDNYNYSTNTNTNKKNLIFSKTIFLNREDSNNFKYMTNTLQINQKEEILGNSKKNYELCDKIKIKLLNNYGNRDYIGLSGIEFYDNNNKLINVIENKKSITINENIVNLREKKILYNLFNNKNNTIDPQYMFLTSNCNAFIKIEFKNSIKISKIIFYNYNNNLYKNCATKGILIYFYYNKKSNKINKPIYLYKPPGEENIDYGQALIYPFDKNLFYEKMIKENKIYLNLNSYKMIYNEEYQYYTPFLPFGYILKIEMISNYGNKNYIGFENIQLFNEDNNEINIGNTSEKKNGDYKVIDYSIDSKNNENIDSNNINIVNPRIYSLPDLQKINLNNRPLVLSKYHFFNDANNKLGENRIYFIFNECIVLSRICINNYDKYLDIAVKDIKILLDDSVIFEGVLKNMGVNNIYFNDKKSWNKNNDKNVKNVLNNNTTTIPKGLVKNHNHNGVHINKFLGKTFDYKQKGINYKNNDERYFEYEGKNGTKILKLNTEF